MEEICFFQAEIDEKYPILQDVYVVYDIQKLRLEKSGDAVVQEIFYNRWKHDHYVRIAFVFAPSEVVNACDVNAPAHCMTHA